MPNRNSKLLICKNIKLDKSYKNVLSYNEQQMLSLCSSNDHLVRISENYSFIRNQNYINTKFSYDDCLKCNYMAFQNPDYSNKWFFAFIDNVEYLGENSTRIYYTIDVFSTWFDYWDPSPCFVEREHVNDDTVGLHTIPEGLETGDYIINESNNLSNKMNLCYICVAVTYVPDNTPQLDYEGRVYNNIFSGNLLLLFRNADDCTRFIKCYDKMSRAEAITNIYMVPILATGVSPDDGPQWKTYTYGSGSSAISTEFAILPYSLGDAQIEQDLTVSNINSLNGYTPKNNKLKVFPYSYLSITNNNGAEVTFKYEDFINNLPTFDISCNVTAGAQNMLIPKNYKLYGGIEGHDVFYNYGLAGGKFPTCSWNTDPYVNWLTENGVNIMGFQIDAPMAQAIGGSIEAILGAASIANVDPKTGATTVSSQGVSGIGSGLGKMIGAVQEQWRHSLQSPTLNGQVSSGDLSYSHGNTLFTYYKMSIKYEYAAIIDDWFTRFGYKINRVKQPNLIGRTHWNFVKIGASEDIGFSNNLGSVPTNSMEIINTIFRNGVTIWHNHDNLGNYNLDNSL